MEEKNKNLIQRIEDDPKYHPTGIECSLLPIKLAGYAIRGVTYAGVEFVSECLEIPVSGHVIPTFIRREAKPFIGLFSRCEYKDDPEGYKRMDHYSPCIAGTIFSMAGWGIYALIQSEWKYALMPIATNILSGIYEVCREIGR